MKPSRDHEQDFSCRPSTSTQSFDEHFHNDEFNISEKPENSPKRAHKVIHSTPIKLLKSRMPAELLEGANDEEIVKMWKQMDEKLERNARQHNLSAFNVKSILHHFIKNPSTLSMFMGIADGETNTGLPSVKITRSKVKKDETNTKELKLRPVNTNLESKRPHSFLDLSYDDEEDDEDYQPSESTNDEAAASEIDETSLEGEIADVHEESFLNRTLTDDQFVIDLDNEKGYELRSRTSNLNDAAIHDELADSNNEIIMTREADVFSNVDDCYREFLYGLQETDTKHDNNLDIGDDDDTDYNPQEDLELEEEIVDKEEVMVNRFTEIPRREVEGMFRDLLDDRTIQETIPSLMPLNASKQPNNLIQRAESKPRVRRRPDFVKTADVPIYNDSCTLLNDKISVYFRACEYDQLQIQLEQHVQLLTQGVVLCNHDPSLYSVKDRFQTMINDIDSKFYEFGSNSFFNISNLEGSIKTCHDILKIREVAASDIKWANSIYQGFFPRPEACLAMSRSEAILYPKLIPILQPTFGLGCTPFFSPNDDLLLALGLMQFGHVPNSTRRDYAGRYYLIAKHILKSKSTCQIRNHLKNVRIRSDGNVLYKIIVESEDGYPNLTISSAFNDKFEGTMMSWPADARPIWFEMFWNTFELESENVLSKIFPKPMPEVPKQKGKKNGSTEKKSRASSRGSRLETPSPLVQSKSVSPASNLSLQSHTPGKCVPISMPSSGALLVGSPAVGFQLINLSQQQMFYVSNPSDPIEIPIGELMPEDQSVKDQLEMSLTPVPSPDPQSSTSCHSEKQQKKTKSATKQSTSSRKRVQAAKKEKSPPTKRRKLVNEPSVRITRSRAKREISPIAKEKEILSEPSSRCSSRRKRNDDELLKVEEKNDITPSSDQIIEEEIPVTPLISESRAISSQSENSDVLPRANSLASGTISICSNISGKHNDSVCSKHSSPTHSSAEMDDSRNLSSCNGYDYSGFVLPPSFQCGRNAMNSCIPKTPVPRTPSDSSPIPSPMHLSVTKSEICENTIIPLTPRDDGYSQSPSIPITQMMQARAITEPTETSQAVRSLFNQADSDSSTSSKENYYEVPRQTTFSTSFSLIAAEIPDPIPSTSSNMESELKEDKKTGDEDEYECEDIRVAGSSQLNVEDIPKRGKKRTREEKNTDGKLGMSNDAYRIRQECSLAKKIAFDVKQRLSMHNEVYSQVQKIMSSLSSQAMKMEQLEELLYPDHVDALCLLTVLVDNDALSKKLLLCPLRRSYRAAFNILLAIESYATHVRLKPTAKNLFKTLTKIGPFTSDDVYPILKDMIGNEKPLWSYLKKFSPLPYEEESLITDYEFVDLTKDDITTKDMHYEVISSLDAILGGTPCKKGNKIQVNGEHLFGQHGSVYVPVNVKFTSCKKQETKLSSSDVISSTLSEPQNEEEQPLWTRSEDLSILTTFTGLDCDENAALQELSKVMSYSEEHIKSRLHFLLSFV